MQVDFPPSRARVASRQPSRTATEWRASSEPGLRVSVRRESEVEMTQTDGRPPTLTWNYSRPEMLADGLVHALGLVFAACGAAALLILCIDVARGTTFATAWVYAVSLVVSLGISAAYNMWPISPTKWILRRFDHASIYLLIAGTYTPILTRAQESLVSTVLLVAVWVVAIMGMILKFALPGRLDRLSIGLYLMLGWSGLLAVRSVVSALSATALCLIVIGGVLYSIGVVFHVWRRLRFQNVIWHAFVLVAAGCHYGAILDCLVFVRA
jgi:hemolysin III